MHRVDVKPLKPDQPLGELLAPTGSGGLLASLYLLRRLYALGEKGFEGLFAHGGQEPFYPAGTLVPAERCEVLRTKHAAFEARWFFRPADGQLVGESPVEGGRWLVEGSNLLDSPRRELRVEAIEPGTGKLLGVAAITVEIELPDGGTPPDERPETTPDLGSGVAPAPEPAPPVATTPTPIAAPPALAENETPLSTILPEAESVSEPAVVIEPEVV